MERIQNCAPIMGLVLDFFTPNLIMHTRVASFMLSIQGVTGGTDQTSGECSLGQTITI